jgi:hypothetical protein
LNRQRRNNGFIFFFVGLFLLICVEFLGAGVTTTRTSEPADSATLPAMSRYLPIWVRGYLEVYNLDRQFDHLGWMMQLIESPDDSVLVKPFVKNSVPDIARQFDAVLRHNLNIAAREFAEQLLPEHFVIAWGGPAMRDQFALICEVKDTRTIDHFLMINQASPDEVVVSKIEGRTVPVAAYQLKNSSIRAAVIDKNILVLATVGGGAKASMYHAMVELAQRQTQTNLPKSTQFQNACSQIRPGYESMFVLLMDHKNRLYPENSEALYDQMQSRISYLALAGYPQKDRLQVQVNIQPRCLDPDLLPDKPIELDPLLRKLIDPRSDLIYLSSFNPNRWYRRISELSEHDNDIRQYRDMIDLALPDQQFRDNLLKAVGPEIMVLVSREPLMATTRPVTTTASTQATQSVLATEPVAGPETAEIAMVIRSKNPSMTMAAANQMFDVLSGLNALQAFISGSSTQTSPLSEENYRGVVVHRVDLGQIVPADSENHFGGWRPVLAWAQIQDYLLITSSPSMIHRLIDRAMAPQESVLFGENILEKFSPEIHWLVSFRPGAVSRDTMSFREIFEHFRKAMKDDRLDKLAEVPVVLGIGTKAIPQADGNGSVVQIAAVLPGYPSWERLKVGDIILSVDGGELSLQSPQKELHNKIAGARSAMSVRFGILRKGKKIEVDIPLARNSFHQTVRSIELLGRVLRTLGAKFGRIDLACRYTTEGQILLNVDFVVKSSPSATAGPVTQPVEAR